MMNTRQYSVEEALQEKMAQAGQAECGSALRGDVGNGPKVADRETRAGFQERLHSRLGHIEREGRKGAALNELLYLLDKNPEVARILELIELVGQ